MFTVFAAVDHCTAWGKVSVNTSKPHAPLFAAFGPEGNGCIERFQTVKEQLLWIRHFQRYRN